MKKGFTLFLICFVFLSLNAQKKEQAKDTVKTEVVNIITKYNPKIADAKKIKKNPKIKLLQKNEKKKLEYSIFSAPVASTFIPKSGVVKGIDVGVKERIYKNYLAAGFGNYKTPYFETYLHHSARFKNEFGFNAKYLASQDNIRSSVLNSNFSNFNIGAFYKQQDRYFDWKVSLNSERNLYNWYGLPDIIFTEPTTNFINEEQVYNYFELNGEFNFVDSYIDYGKIKTSYFTDRFNSSEILAEFDVKLDIPLSFLSQELNAITIKNSVEFLKGEFKNSYKDFNPIKYSTTTINLNPYYKMSFKNFNFKTGLKTIASLDSENNATNIFIIPDLFAQGPIIKQYLNIYAGISGDLNTNTYKSFTEENPYVSPTLFITQTFEKSNLFIGFNGKVNSNISFNIKASSITEEDKPLFLRNASKSDGTNNIVNGHTLKGYEYGNSFNVYYDDVKTTSLFTEIEYDFSKNLSLGIQGTYNMYTLENALENWNLPTIEASFSSKYKKNKWFATANIFYVNERKDAIYNGQFPTSFKGIKTLNSFVDVNLNGGYHFNDKFSAFLKLNNILNTDYQRFANFNTQGFQVLGGITYKFDF
ncbi:TonB-dependent receptor [Polaribacter sp. Hel1_85]|uniref:TonB-dependent receptor n=1 Tax=Polaribacter sp. Hel1_85 TaxID=1250005 RepID=UPI00052BAC92|nr:TonB-dependent receptor [Polaribacter sp. Hel1_85]KGL62786.1 putative TonB-dependent receptor [Polaribacter sp. Hel1_85]